MWEARVKKRVCLASSWLGDWKREGLKGSWESLRTEPASFWETIVRGRFPFLLLRAPHPGVSYPVQLGS